MGADLRTFIMIGPKEVKMSARQEDAIVKKVVKDILTRVSKANMALKKIHECDLESLCANSCYADWLREWLDEFDTAGAGEVLPDMNYDSVRLLIRLAVAYWNDPDFRDCDWRFCGEGKAMRRIVVAGELSWGDEPDGEAYQLCKKAEILKIWKLLGIE